ncbi:hypothetical protein AgCh_032945 [Apium graveolens]
MGAKCPFEVAKAYATERQKYIEVTKSLSRTIKGLRLQSKVSCLRTEGFIAQKRRDAGAAPEEGSPTNVRCKAPHLIKIILAYSPKKERADPIEDESEVHKAISAHRPSHGAFPAVAAGARLRVREPTQQTRKGRLSGHLRLIRAIAARVLHLVGF